MGDLVLKGDAEGLTGMYFMEGSRNSVFPPKNEVSFQETDYFVQTKQWLQLYFAGHDPGFLPRIHLTGSAFRMRVAEIMCEIPFGETVTYGWIAARIAAERGLMRMSAQAVGGAVGHNPICLIVPCHRVVGADGSLTGYGGGIARKKALLELEGIDTSCFYVPKTGTAL